jgi:uncharacterized protein (TIGR02466 family)
MSKVAKKCKAAESVAEVVTHTQLEVAYHFPCPIYIIERPDFLDAVKAVSDEQLEVARKERDLNEIYPVVMTGNYYADARVTDFANFVGATAWNILQEQGYAMEDKVVQFTEMWTQEHHKHSSMEQHVHGFGVQIVGFYFLETPEDSSRVVFHDPRAGKVQNDLPEQNMANATPASRMVNFEAKEGRLIFSNSWLPHSFTRHASDKPVKFVHFNLTVQQAEQLTCIIPTAEII